MRFLPEGPNIPDELLEARDNGKVVFLCGAGVSYPAGMPDFLGLARFVVGELGTPKSYASRDMLSMWEEGTIPAGARPSLDQIFNLLQQEYPPGEVDYLIAKRLKTPRGVNLSTHETVLRLSRSSDGKPQIVTTNFDRLFEKAAHQRVKTHVAPALPDLTGMQSFDGIVYLHGRIDNRIKRGEGRQNLVVSSADFGRAYLAEGWATRFVRDLLDQYIVILLGYSANDPPVRYLLQGLHAGGQDRAAGLFAFDSGAQEEVQARWRDSGVRALAYPSTDGHTALWSTLSAWANRADDPLAWQRKVVDLARKGPRNLSPHERGRVASLVRTDVGAKLFADADPPPSGEWLCVFDHHVRYGQIGRDPVGAQPDFDPLLEYGLDDDPARPANSTVPTEPPGDDLLVFRSGTLLAESRTRLAGVAGGSTVPLPSRLAHVARWIEKVAPEPVTAWWAAKYHTLHPDLLNGMELRVSQADGELPSLAESTWKLLIECLHTPGHQGPVNPAWYRWLQRWHREGWTNGVLRAFEQVTKPHLTSRLLGGLNRARPPGEDWGTLCQTDIVSFNVAFPAARRDRPVVSEEALPAVYRTLRKHLEIGAGLLADIGWPYLNTATFYPESGPGKNLASDASAFLLWFRELFDRMTTTHPEQLRADIALWPTEDPFFFIKLHLYAWASNVLFSGKDVADGLLTLSDDSFWTGEYHRELLHLLLCRWHDIPIGKRRHLERRFAEGPSKFPHESKEDYDKRRSFRAATNLGWLKRNGCEIGNTTLKVLRALRGVEEDWLPEWDGQADVSYDGRVVDVRTNLDPGPLVTAPLDQIVSLALEHTRSSRTEHTNYRPFDGLVKQYPRRAVAALSLEARKGHYPVDLWASTLREWPQATPPRLDWLFGERLARLPSKTARALRGAQFRWVQNYSLKMGAEDQPRFLRIFDKLVEAVFEGDPSDADGETGQIYFTGEHQHRSPRTFEHAMTSPVGTATKLLLDLLTGGKPNARSQIPLDLKSRLERLMAAPSAGTDHAVCIVARHLRGLDDVDPYWVRATVLPWFDAGHSNAEPAWNGFLHDNMLPCSSLFSSLKPHFLNVFSHAWIWNWSEGPFLRLHEFLVLACFWRRKNSAYVSYDEARRALQATNDAGRAHSLDFLSHTVLHGDPAKWRRFGKPFLEKAWPREERFRAEETSRRLADLVKNAGDMFPEVVRTISPHLIPIRKGGLFAIPLGQGDAAADDAPARRFPDATLALIDKLVPDNPDQAPYKLDIVVEAIGEAKPSLRQDSRWRRLRKVVLHR